MNSGINGNLNDSNMMVLLLNSIFNSGFSPLNPEASLQYYKSDFSENISEDSQTK